MPNVSASFRASSVAAIVVALVTLTPTAGSAQGHGDHLMVAPTDLKWADVPSLPPGVKIAVIEGPMNEAKPFTMRLRLPADDQIPAHSHSAIEHVTVISATFTGAGLPILDAGPRVPYAEPQLYCAPGRIWRGRPYHPLALTSAPPRGRAPREDAARSAITPDGRGISGPRHQPMAQRAACC
jgi:hypothetical protein